MEEKPMSIIELVKLLMKGLYVELPLKIREHLPQHALRLVAELSLVN